MSNYNSGSKYNFSGDTGGILYNSAQFVVMINLFETMRASDSVSGLTARNILNDNVGVFESLIQYALFPAQESFSANDDVKFCALQTVAENLGVKDILNDIIVAFYIAEKQAMIDRLKEVNAYISKEETVKISEIKTIETLLNVLDGAGFKDVSKTVAQLYAYERAYGSDKTPKKAISDFLIGKASGLDTAHDWFLPLKMMYDPSRSEIQVMPQTETSYIQMPYMDGSIPENTVYQNRLYNVVLWSQDGLTIAQKEQLKADIARLLDSTKNRTKKLTIQSADIAFDVKYSGVASIKEGPSYVKAELPLETSPYGTPLFAKAVFGSGLIVNEGDKDVGAVHEIRGGCNTPKFQVGSITYVWDGSVPINKTLVIDNQRLVCYLEDTQGGRENAIDRLTGEFQIIPKGKTYAITAFGDTGSFLTTRIKEKILWKK